MSDDLTDDQIALLCDIGEFDTTKQTDSKKRDLDRLFSGGYVQTTQSQLGSAFKLTAAGGGGIRAQVVRDHPIGSEAVFLQKLAH